MCPCICRIFERGENLSVDCAVAGRTGRGEGAGKVLVQTHHPEHYALQAATAHDYVKFSSKS